MALYKVVPGGGGDQLGEGFQLVHWSNPMAYPPHSQTLCGQLASAEFKFGAEGEFCVVCQDMHQRVEVEA